MPEQTEPVLIVVADEEARFALTHFLGYDAEPVVASCLEDARSIVASRWFSVAIVEADLPDGSGLQLTAALRSRVPWAQVLCICSMEETSRTPEFIASGANDVLATPFDVGTLPGRLARLQRAGVLRRGELQRRAALEAQVRHLDRVALLGTLVATVAHETASPLTIMLGDTDELEDLLRTARDLDSFRREGGPLIHEVATAARAMAAYVEKLRSFSRREDTGPVEASMADVVASALSFVKRKIAANGSNILVQLGAPPPELTCYPTELAQAVANAVSNAIDAAGQGGSIWVHMRADERGHVLVVEDDGPGIPEADRARILEPFFTTKPTGTGLGMGVIDQVMRLHSGRLELHEGERASGLAVWLILPQHPRPRPSTGVAGVASDRSPQPTPPDSTR